METDKELNDLLDFTAVRSLLRLINDVEYVVISHHILKGMIRFCFGCAEGEKLYCK